MFSRRTRGRKTAAVFAAMAAVFALVSSCSKGGFLKIGEARRIGEPQSVESRSELGCIKTYADDFALVIEGKAPRTKIDELQDCSLKAVKEFAKLTAKKDGGTFTPEELRNFFLRYYIADVEISDRLLGLVMNAKRSFFGGGIERLGPSDLESLLRSLETVYDVMRDVHPYLPISLDKVANLSVKDSDDFARVIVRGAERLSALLHGDENSPFSFGDFRALLAETESIAPELSEKTIEYLDLYEKGKATFLQTATDEKAFAERAKSLHVSELKLTIDEAAKLFAAFMRIHQLFSAEGLDVGAEGRDRLFTSASDFIAFMERALARNGGRIPISRITAIVTDARVLSLGGSDPKSKIKPETLSKLIDSLMGRVLGQNDRGLRKFDSLLPGHVSGLRNVVREWYVLKSWTDRQELALAKSLKADIPAAGLLLKRGNLTNVTEKVEAEFIASLPFTPNEVQLQSYRDYRKFLAENPALFIEGHRALMVSDQFKLRSFTRFELNLYAIIRPALGAIMRGYSDRDTGVKNAGPGEGVLITEFETFVRDIYTLLQEIRFLSKMNKPEMDSAKRFREGSLFVFCSDGDPYLGINEGTQLVLFLAEAKSAAKKIIELTEKKCKLGPDDEFGKPLVEPDCYRRVVYDFDNANPDSKELWADFPNLREYYTGLTEKEREEFRFLFEIPSRDLGYQKTVYFNSAESETAGGLVRYIETVFERFDEQPRNKTLGPLEAKGAFPIFRNELHAFKPKFDDKTLYAAFTWLLANGGLPVSDQMAWWENGLSLSKFAVWWVEGDQRWKFESTRRNLVSVFGVITQEAAAAVEAAEAARR